MALDDTDDGDDETGLKGLKSQIEELTDPSTSQEAQDYARKILGRNLSDPTSGAEADLMTRMENQAADARSKLQAARDKLAARRINPAEGWFALSAALGSPTKTGSFGETIGNASRSMLPFLQDKRNFEGEQDKELLGIDSQLNGIDTAQIQERLKALQGKQSNDTKMSVAALNMLGKRTRDGAGTGGTGWMSPGYKRALSEGKFKLGTPEFNRQVQIYEDQLAKQASAKAGTDEGDLSPEEDQQRRGLANERGVPYDSSDPYAGLSTKVKQTRLGMAAKDNQKVLDDLNQEAPALMQNVQDAQRFDDLIDHAPHSGAFINALENLHDPLGIAGAAHAYATGDPISQELKHITDRLTPLMRAKGSGATSNYEDQIYKGALFGLGKSPEANHVIAQGYKQVWQRQLDKTQFMNDYFAVNPKGTGARANAEWMDYVNHNPTVILNPKDPTGIPLLNPEYKNYKDYFRSKYAAPKSAPVITGDVEEDPNSATSTEITDDDNLPAIEPQRHAEGGLAEPLSESDLARLLGKALMNQSKPSPMTPVYADDSSDSDDPTAAALIALLSKQGSPGYADGGPVDTGSISSDPDNNEQSAWEDAASALAQGATLGFSDELAGSPHERKLARKELHKASVDKPVSTGMLELLGSTAPGVAASLLLRNPGGVAARLGLAGAGATISGIGTGEGETAPYTERENIPLGLKSGILGSLAAKYGVKGAFGLQDAMGFGVDKPTQSMLTAMKADQVSPDDFATGMSEARKAKVPQTIFDQLGASGARLSTMAMQRGSGDAGKLTNNLIDRNASARDRTADAVNQALKPDPYLATEKDILNRRSDEAKDAYNRMYAQFPSVKSPELFQMMKTPAGKEIAKDAFRQMQNDQVPIGPIDAKGMVRNPSLQYLDYYKQAIDKRIRNAKVNPDSKDPYSTLSDMKSRFVSSVDAATADPQTGVSPYATTRAQYGDTSSILDALHSGREEFDSETPESLQAKMKNMSYMEKDAYLSGVGENLFRQIGKPSGEGVNAAQGIVGSPDKMAKLQAIMSPADFKVFQAGLQREASMYGRSKNVLKNAGKLPGQVAESPSLSLMDTLKNLVTRGGMSESEADAHARTLMLGSKQDVADLVSRLAKASKTMSRRSKIAAVASGAGAVAGSTLFTPNPKPQTQEGDEDQ